MELQPLYLVGIPPLIHLLVHLYRRCGLHRKPFSRACYYLLTGYSVVLEHFVAILVSLFLVVVLRNLDAYLGLTALPAKLFHLLGRL